MFQLIGVIIAALFVVLIIDVPRIAVVAGLVALGIGWLAVLTWHRRQLAELREREGQLEGRWIPVNRAVRWPKRCGDCHHRVNNWAEALAHRDPDRSPCAALRAALEARADAEQLERAAAPEWTAEVIPGPRGGIDTLTDDEEGGD
jgi:hypothetical protein